MRIVFRKSLNRYYDEDAKRIVSKRVAKKWFKRHNSKRFTKSLKNKINATGKHSRPSYKQLYLKECAKNRVLNKKNMFPKFHPFMVNRYKHADVTPHTLMNEVRQWNEDHEGKLFLVAELATDGQYIVRACGKVNDLEAGGFGARDVVPSMISIFEDGYQDN